MNQKRELYLMLSQTATGIGKAIRMITQYEYNHVSLSLDPEFRQWVSFARYTQEVPLAGGFVSETPERFCAAGEPVKVKIFRLEISETRYRKLKSLFAQAGNPDCGLIYNTISPIATLFGMQFPIPGAYSCLEFANAVLEKFHPSIQALDEHYGAMLIYEGLLQELAPDCGSREGSYFVHRGFWGGAADTALHFARLVRRMVHSTLPDPVNAMLH